MPVGFLSFAVIFFIIDNISVYAILHRHSGDSDYFYSELGPFMYFGTFYMPQLAILFSMFINLAFGTKITDDKNIFNEQTKLLANAFNTISTACFSVCILTPLSGYVYNISNIREKIDGQILLWGSVDWFLVALVVHCMTRNILEGMRS